MQVKYKGDKIQLLKTSQVGGNNTVVSERVGLYNEARG